MPPVEPMVDAPRPLPVVEPDSARAGQSTQRDVVGSSVYSQRASESVHRRLSRREVLQQYLYGGTVSGDRLKQRPAFGCRRTLEARAAAQAPVRPPLE